MPNPAKAPELREGPKVTIDYSCTGCRHLRSEKYECQSDWGFDRYCDKEGGRHISAFNSNTPDWCPLRIPPTPAPSEREDCRMYTADDLEEISRALRQHAERGGWVPVSERLPENHNTGSTTKGSRFARVLGCNDAMPQLGSFEVYLRFPGDYWDARKEYAWETPAGEAIEITHWQLLPTPPTE